MSASLWRALSPALATIGTAKTTHCEAAADPPPKIQPAVLRKRMTSIGHFSLLTETPTHPSIMAMFMTVQGHLTAAQLAQHWQDRVHHQHDRLGHVVSTHAPGYFETSVEPPRITSTTHVPPLHEWIPAHLTTRWNLSDYLWQLQVVNTTPNAPPKYSLALPDDDDQTKATITTSTDTPVNHKDQTLLLFHGHHALGDGASMAAVLMQLADEADDFRRKIAAFVRARRANRKSWWEKLQQLWRLTWTSLRSWAYHLSLLWCHYVWDAPTWALLSATANHADRVVGWVSHVATVDQVRWVAKTLGGPQTTINDVWVACVAAAVRTQWTEHVQRQEQLQAVQALLAEEKDKTPSASSKKLLPPSLTNLHVTIPVHLQGGVLLPGQSIGNRLGAVTVRLHPDDKNATENLQHTHAVLQRRLKESPGAPLWSHIMARTVGFWTPYLPFLRHLFAAAHGGSTVVVTNVRGPSQPIHLQGHAVQDLHGFVPLPPGIPLGVVVQSYAQHISLTVTAQPWAVPDPNHFLHHVLAEYVRLVEAATEKERRQKQ